MIRATPTVGARFAADLPYTIGELRYSVANEMAHTLGDLLIRRTHLAFETRDHGVAAAPSELPRRSRAAARVGRPPISGARSRSTSRGGGRFWAGLLSVMRQRRPSRTRDYVIWAR